MVTEEIGRWKYAIVGVGFAMDQLRALRRISTNFSSVSDSFSVELFTAKKMNDQSAIAFCFPADFNWLTKTEDLHRDTIGFRNLPYKKKKNRVAYEHNRVKWINNNENWEQGRRGEEEEGGIWLVVTLKHPQAVHNCRYKLYFSGATVGVIHLHWCLLAMVYVDDHGLYLMQLTERSETKERRHKNPV